MLTPEAIKERRKGLGGSDAGKIVSGDWHTLWLDKTGRSEAEDLSGVWPVQLGNCTESLNLEWYARKTGHLVTRLGEVVICPEYPILRCTLDGFDEGDGLVIQAKHVNGFSKIEDVRARYEPQVRHEMIVCGAERGILSVIIGSNEPVLELIEHDEFWANDYIDRCHQFWRYVEKDEEPPQGKPLEAAPAPIVMRTVDMSGSNAWASGAADWLNHGAAAKLFEAAKSDLKKFMLPDMKEAFGHGVRAVRSRNGSISIKEM